MLNKFKILTLVSSDMHNIYSIVHPSLVANNEHAYGRLIWSKNKSPPKPTKVPANEVSVFSSQVIHQALIQMPKGLCKLIVR